jgi:hypothetical protein
MSLLNAIHGKLTESGFAKRRGTSKTVRKNKSIENLPIHKRILRIIMQDQYRGKVS